VRTTLAYLPSPSQGVWLHGVVKAYALCIVLGIIAAVWIGERRWVARGGQRGTVSDVAIRAVIFGLIGGRLYHVITDWELYFGEGRHPVDALKVWNGGLGIWGAISLGALGAWLGCRAEKVPFRAYADAVVPGVAVAQAIGRWGNWFNQELFGRPTTLPWGLKIDPSRPDTVPGAVAYHPTFLYESIWDLGLAGVLVWADRRFTLGRGRVLALYIMGYPLGRIWIEALRIDTAHHIFGLRLNIWTSILVFLGGLALFLLSKGPREVLATPGATPDGTTVEGTTVVDDGSAEDEAADAEAAADEAAEAEADDEAADELEDESADEDDVRTPEAGDADEDDVRTPEAEDAADKVEVRTADAEGEDDVRPAGAEADAGPVTDASDAGPVTDASDAGPMADASDAGPVADTADAGPTATAGPDEDGKPAATEALTGKDTSRRR
jgi:prolipoprotein diacylglyceryl transferase